jgi:hypothetical protein
MPTEQGIATGPPPGMRPLGLGFGPDLGVQLGHPPPPVGQL